MSERAAKIDTLLREHLTPSSLEVIDESAAHAGHAGAASGGGHFAVRIVADAFRGRSAVERHRIVYRALGEMFPREVHALAIEALAPEEI